MQKPPQILSKQAQQALCRLIKEGNTLENVTVSQEEFTYRIGFQEHGHDDTVFMIERYDDEFIPIVYAGIDEEGGSPFAESVLSPFAAFINAFFLAYAQKLDPPEFS